MIYSDTKRAQIAGAQRFRLIGRLFRAVMYAISFILPILLAGGIGFSMSLGNSKAGPPPAVRAAAVPQPAPPYDPHKPTVAIVLGDVSDANDVLAPYALFAESAAYNVYTVASSRDLHTLTDGLDLVPHYSFDELRALLGRSPDIVVAPAIPTILEPQNRVVIDWIKQQAKQPTILFSWCEGAQVLAASGVLDGLPATTHWGAIDGFERAYPAVRWQRGVRYVDQGSIITAAGLTAGIDATLHLLTRLHGPELAQQVATTIHYPSLQNVEHPQVAQFRPAPADGIALLNGAFDWPKRRAGVWLYNGVGELDLAAALETYGATWTYRLDTLADAPTVTSRHGLQLIPRWQAPHVPPVGRVLVPGGAGAEQIAAALPQMQARLGMPVAMLGDPARPRFAYASALEEFARQQDAPTARFAAKRLEYRAEALSLDGPAWPFQVVIVPLLLGVAGVAGMRWLLGRVSLGRRRLA